MNVASAIRMKRAVRQFAPRPVPEADVLAILTAGRRAQSSKNTQPWHFIAIRDRETLTSLATTGTYAGHLAGAALAVAIVTADPVDRWSILFDAGQAAAYMQLAAWELGIGSCLATIYDRAAAQGLLGVPAELHLHVAISFGYPADPNALSRLPQAGGRRPLEDLVHHERW